MNPWNKMILELECFTALESLGVGFKNEFDLISNPTELVKDFLLGSCGMSGVIEAPMETVELTGEHRACLIGVATDGDDGINGAIQELIKMLRAMPGDIDADLLHHLDGLGVNIPGGLGSSAGNLDKITSSGAKHALGEVTAARVSGAENEDKWFHGGKGNKSREGADADKKQNVKK